MSDNRATLQPILDLVDQRRDEIIAFASEFVQKRLVNPDLGPNEEAERPAQEWIRGQLEASGAFDEIDF